MTSLPKIQQKIHESEPGDWIYQEGPFGNLETNDPVNTIHILKLSLPANKDSPYTPSTTSSTTSSGHSYTC